MAQPPRGGAASSLYRAPTWAKNIDFGNTFDLGQLSGSLDDIEGASQQQRTRKQQDPLPQDTSSRHDGQAESSSAAAASGSRGSVSRMPAAHDAGGPSTQGLEAEQANRRIASDTIAPVVARTSPRNSSEYRFKPPAPVSYGLTFLCLFFLQSRTMVGTRAGAR